MYSGTASVASHHVGENRITRAGRIIRRFKIDELPQVINVLLGDMSFVGPRPSLANQHELIAERTVCGVLALRPGITGPAQLAGIDMSTPRELAIADAAYLGAWSLRRDLTILAGTVVKGRGDAARRSTAAPGPDGSTE